MAVGQQYFSYPASHLATADQILPFCCLSITTRHHNNSIICQLSQVMASLVSLTVAPSCYHLPQYYFLSLCCPVTEYLVFFFPFLKISMGNTHISWYVYIYLPDLASKSQCSNKSSGHNCVRSFMLSQECSGRFSFFYPLALSINVLNPVERFRLIYITK